MPILDHLAATIGSAVRSYQIAVSGGANIADKSARRPAFLDTVAQAEKWKGGDLGEKDAAYKRALQNSWVYTAINYKASEMAANHLYVAQADDSLDEDAQPVPNHPFTRLLRRPNPLMGRGYMWRYTHWWLDLSGNSYWFLAPDEYGNLAEIWPLPANAVNPFPGDKERLVDYYEYTVNGILFKIPAEYICHFRYPNPYDYFRGLSPLVASLLPSDSDSAMAFWNGAFFGQENVMPSAVISLSSGDPASPIDPADVEAVKEQLVSEHSASARKTIVTNAYNMAVNVLGWSAKDMDFLAGRAFTRDEIFNVYGIPGGLLDKNATEANSTTADNVFKEKTLWPLLTGIYADAITAQVIQPWYSPNEQAMFNDIRPVNNSLILQEAAASIQDMTRQERRARFWNLPPLGDERDKEIPGAVPPQVGNSQFGGIVGSAGDPYPGAPVTMPNPMNAIPDLSKHALSVEALADLRRWRDVAVKSLKSGKPLPEFKSAAIPAELADNIRVDLKSAQNADEARELFSLWMSGEASTKASPFSTNIHDDPYAPIKRAAESELQTELEQYFAELAERIAEQEALATLPARADEGRKHLPGQHDQADHAGKGGSTDDKTIGFSFLSGDTRLASTAEARKVGESPDGWAKHEHKFKNQYLKRFNLEDDVERTFGFWGGPEPSFNAHLKGKRENVIAMSKAWAKEHNQQGMALLFPNLEGAGGKLKWDFGKELSDDEMDSFFKNLDDLNKDFGDEYNDYFGVTMKNSRNIEYWFKDDKQRSNAYTVINMAINKTKLPAGYDKEDGFDFVLLRQGMDY